MKRKIIWLILSSMMVAALLLASCAPAVTEEEEVIAPPEEEEKVVTEEEVAPAAEEPTYGGVLNIVVDVPDFMFDETYSFGPYLSALELTHDELLTGDWSRGPAGTGEVTWIMSPFNPEFEKGSLAESWEIPDYETAIYHIRKGVHWQGKPPVNGRELIADDVAYTLSRQVFGGMAHGLGMKDGTRPEQIRSIEATDRYTVVVKNTEDIRPPIGVMAEKVRIMAPEAGGPPPGDHRDWRNCVGTGPFMIVDYALASSVSTVRNPNYWMKDPFQPENTLPYVDKVNMLIIPDASTRMAALRTGKIAVLSNLGWEDKDSLVKTNPELKWLRAVTSSGEGTLIGMRTDREGLPFQYEPVRRALSMSIDRQAIADDYYGGTAMIFFFPVLPTLEFKDMFTPLDELSESIQELWEYKPEKAKQLLADAGYPDGFKTTIACTQNSADLASILKEYWAKTGVEVGLEVRDAASHKGVSTSHGGMYLAGYPADHPQLMAPFSPTGIGNPSGVDDPYVNELHARLLKIGDHEWGKHSQIMKEEIVPYVLEQCWYMSIPKPDAFIFWQPWLKGYHGELEVGFRNAQEWTKYVWIDQELKKEMTGR